MRDGASPAEIRAAFAAAVRRIHPDRGGDPSAAGERLGSLVAARDALLAAVDSTAPPRSEAGASCGVSRSGTVTAGRGAGVVVAYRRRRLRTLARRRRHLLS